MSSNAEPQKLSALDATLLVMGGIIGIGIFFNPSQIAEAVPEPWTFLGLWIFAGGVAMCAALTFAELGATFPRSGGWFVFLREAFGPFPAFLFAWVVLFAVSSGSMAAVLHFAANQMHRLLPEVVGEAGTLSHRVFATGFMLVVTAVGLSGVKRAAMLQNVCMFAKLAVIAALVLAAFAGSNPEMEAAAAARSTAAGSGSVTFNGIVQALLPVFFSYGGWQMVCYLAPQVKDPTRTLPRAITIGVTGVVIVYVAANIAFLHVLGIEGMAASDSFAAEVARLTLGEWGERVLVSGILVSALGICVVIAITTPWLYVAMAKEGLFFSRVGAVHPRTGAPWVALLLQCALVVAYANLTTLRGLVESAVFAEWSFHALVAFALLRLRARRPELPRPFKSFAYPLAPLIYLVAALGVEIGTLVRAFTTDNTGDVKVSLVIVILGALIYRPWRKLLSR